MTESQTRPLLSAVEARALAVLLEKERTVPDSYPMSFQPTRPRGARPSNHNPLMGLRFSVLLREQGGRGGSQTPCRACRRTFLFLINMLKIREHPAKTGTVWGSRTGGCAPSGPVRNVRKPEALADPA